MTTPRAENTLASTVASQQDARIDALIKQLNVNRDEMHQAFLAALSDNEIKKNVYLALWGQVEKCFDEVQSKKLLSVKDVYAAFDNIQANNSLIITKFLGKNLPEIYQTFNRAPYVNQDDTNLDISIGNGYYNQLKERKRKLFPALLNTYRNLALIQFHLLQNRPDKIIEEAFLTEKESVDELEKKLAELEETVKSAITILNEYDKPLESKRRLLIEDAKNEANVTTFKAKLAQSDHAKRAAGVVAQLTESIEKETKEFLQCDFIFNEIRSYQLLKANALAYLSGKKQKEGEVIAFEKQLNLQHQNIKKLIEKYNSSIQQQKEKLLTDIAKQRDQIKLHEHYNIPSLVPQVLNELPALIALQKTSKQLFDVNTQLTTVRDNANDEMKAFVPLWQQSLIDAGQTIIKRDNAALAVLIESNDKHNIELQHQCDDQHTLPNAAWDHAKEKVPLSLGKTASQACTFLLDENYQTLQANVFNQSKCIIETKVKERQEELRQYCYEPNNLVAKTLSSADKLYQELSTCRDNIKKDFEQIEQQHGLEIVSAAQKIGLEKLNQLEKKMKDFDAEKKSKNLNKHFSMLGKPPELLKQFHRQNDMRHSSSAPDLLTFQKTKNKPGFFDRHPSIAKACRWGLYALAVGLVFTAVTAPLVFILGPGAPVVGGIVTGAIAHLGMTGAVATYILGGSLLFAGAGASVVSMTACCGPSDAESTSAEAATKLHTNNADLHAALPLSNTKGSSPSSSPTKIKPLVISNPVSSPSRSGHFSTSNVDATVDTVVNDKHENQYLSASI